MKFAYFAKLTLVDYPGHIAATVFTAGCNYRCPFCHNPKLVLPEKIKVLTYFDEQRILAHLEKKKGKLTGLCITGGEPTLWGEELAKFLEKVKALGYDVKLDTNGSNPDVVESYIQRDLIDYVAIDIKTAPHKYHLAIGLPQDVTNKLLSKITHTIDILMNSGIDYEFRTTAVPEYVTMEDMTAIGEFIKGAKKWAIQRYHKDKVLAPDNSPENTYTKEDLEAMAAKVAPYVEKVEIRW